ncbi:TRAP transporter substrate-binding protein DctP [Halobacteria archaeon AArc-dxtr1]|nr:TRAP transporter substrate-binding protein DctP [Halobacteria archaeon AArc-dxtr1]
MNRRRYLACGGVAASSALAGCIDLPGGGGDPSSFTVAGVLSADTESHGWDGVGSYAHNEFVDRVADQTDDLDPSYAGDEQICGEEECPESIVEDVVEVGGASIGNTSGQWPSQDVFLLPYTFPTPAAAAHTITHEETWERYWTPFAEEYGVVPFWLGTPFLRQLYIGEDHYDPDDPVRTPSDVEGLTVRRTESQTASIAFEEWGANPQQLAWGDTVEGLRTGVVDATETWGGAAGSFGMTESLGEVVVTDWTIGYQGWWASVDWLQDLPDEQREALAEVCRELTEDSVHIQREVLEDRIGQTSSPDDGTAYAEDDVAVTMLDDDELDEWRDSVNPQENPELYDQIFDYVDDLGIDGQEFHDYLWEQARADETPSDVEDVSVDTWWDDYIDEL